MADHTIAFPQRNQQTPVGPVSEGDQYTLDCLAGHRFPKPDDSALWDRCKQAWTMREWVELCKCIHLPTCKQVQSMLSRLKLYFPPLLDLRPEEVTRRVVIQWFQEIAQHSACQANNSLVTLKAIFNKAIE